MVLAALVYTALNAGADALNFRLDHARTGRSSDDAAEPDQTAVALAIGGLVVALSLRAAAATHDPRPLRRMRSRPFA